MPQGTTIVDITYNDPRTGERVTERRIQEIPADEIDNVRQREMGMVLAPRREQEDDDYYMRSRGRRDNTNNFLAVDNYPPPRARSYRGAESRRRSPSPGSNSESSDDEYDRRRRRRRSSRRARSARPAKRAPDSADEGLLWYSGKPRWEGNFFERNFDSSYDGLIAAAAGAALGAMTARGFAHRDGDEKKGVNWKTIGGAVVGAAAFNAAENKYSVYTEERAEVKREVKDQVRKVERRVGLD